MVVATGQHDGRVVLHQMMGLEVEVAEHGVGFPPTQQLDFVANNVFVQKRGGAGSTERFGRDIGRGERGGRKGYERLAEKVCDE